MHELSVAEALIDQVHHHAPPGVQVAKVHIEVGPQQSIDSEALQMAWKALTASTSLAKTALCVECLPWNCRCKRCSGTWTSSDPFSHCPLCRSDETDPSGSAALRILSLEVESDCDPVPHDSYLECQA